MLSTSPSPEYVLAVAIVIFFSIGLHEFAHAKVADTAGDPTPRAHGRVTLNLFNHFELFGTIMMIASAMLGFGIGWGKPVPMTPKKMHNPRWDYFSAVIAGPLTNFALAIVFALLFRLGTNMGFVRIYGIPGESIDIFVQPFITTLLMMGMMINISLFFFNLLPIGPLDGMWILGSFMPEKQQILWYQFNRYYGGYIFVALVLFSQFTGGGIFLILGPLRMRLLEILI